jgi:hypothetical protein
MKKQFSALTALLLTVCLFSACVSEKNTLTSMKPAAENLPADNTENCFVEMKDGSIRKFSNLALVTGMFTSPHLLGDGKVKLFASQVKSYLSGDIYAVSQEALVGARKSCVAVETLPGFAIRLVKGRLNLYRKKYFNGQQTIDEFYLQLGDDAPIVAYNAKLMADLIHNNPEAAKYFIGRKAKKGLEKKLIATANLFNDEQQVSVN